MRNQSDYYPGNSIAHSAFIATGDQWYQIPVCQHLVKNIPPAPREVQQIWKQLQVRKLYDSADRGKLFL